MPVTDADVRRLMRATGLPAGKIVRMYRPADFSYGDDSEGWVFLVGGRRAMGLRKPNGRCLFLGPDGRCRVYSARPMTCRTFPYDVRLDQQGRISRLKLNRAVRCRCRPGEGVEPERLRRDAAREDAEDEAYFRRVDRWNRRRPRRTAREFFDFLRLRD